MMFVKQYEWCRKCEAPLVGKSRWPVCSWCGAAEAAGSEWRQLAEAGVLCGPEVDEPELEHEPGSRCSSQCGWCGRCS